MDAAPDPTAGIDPDCDPIAPEHCGVPFPNDFWLIGGHVAFGKNTLPKIRGGDPIDPKSWADSDGFSAGQAPFTYLPGATATGLVSQDEIERSITTDSPTVLMNAETGELMPHFAEIDMSTFHEDDRALILRPAVRLRDRTRYIVAVRHVVDAGGLAIAPSAAFRALRDRIKTTGPLEQRRQHFEDIFARLEKRGIARADLQVAWDYTTASRENNTRVLVAMRDDALKTVGALGPSYRITNIEANPNPWIRKRITGMMTVPLYLDKPESGGRLVLGQDGLPKQNGTAEYEFLLHIPNSATAQNPALLLQNGHGLLGAKSEGQDGYLAMMCGKYNYVAIAVDWIGLAHDDIDLVTDAVASGDIGKFRAAVDRQHQGFVNALLAMRMLQGRMKDDPNMMDGGKPIIDTTQAYYRGDSQGGIFGATYMSISTDITRGLLGEPGMPYNLLLDRSVDFSGFRFLLKGNFPNGIDVQIVLGLIQMIWDRTEPNGYVPYMRENMLPNTPRHEVLIHDAIGDHQVTTLGAHVIARTIGAKNLAPVNRSIWGIEQSSGPIDGSAIVEFDFGLREQKLNLPTMDGEDPHDKVRELDAAMKQSDVFFRTGKVVPVCDGPCNPE
jgi:hypothetical protein